MSPLSRDLTELLSHQGMIHRLARSLVVDEARADDVVQQAWLAALAGGPRQPSSLRAWLAAVVRNLAWKSRRDEARRRERERQAARPEGLPSTVEVVEREAARRALTDALFALDDPFRTTLILRHLEGLPQREIARRMEVPVETVHSRLRTGMERLRRRLDAEYGERRSWSLLLIPGAVPTGAAGLSPVAASVLAGVAVMGLKVKLALLSLAAIATLATVMLLQPRNSEPEGAREVVMSPAAAGVGVLPEIASRLPRDTNREAVVAEQDAEPAAAAPEPAASDPERGALEVTVLYAEDGSPAAAVGLKLHCWGEPDPYSNLRYERTDQRGVARIEGILVGAVSVEADRGGRLGTKVIAGELTSADLVIPAGARVNGLVLDGAGLPVEGAEIFLTSQGTQADGFIVARSAADGSFAIRSLEDMHYVGARAAGYAPSQLPLVLGGAGAMRDVTLILDRRGGALEGRVYGPDGTPLSGALVVVDPDLFAVTWLADRRQALDAIELRTQSGADGRFRFDGVRPGTRTLGVRRPDLAPWRGTVEVREGATERLDARLLAGAVLAGTVTGAAGESVSGVTLQARQMGGFDEVFGRAGADGTFRLEGLPAGTVFVQASADDRGRVEGEVELVAGAERRWDASLSRGRTLAGRLVDEADRPLGDHWISVEAGSHVDDHYRADARTAQDGRFQVTNCPDAPLEVEVHPPGERFFPAVSVRDVRAGAEELLIRLDSRSRPTARIVGIVVDDSGAPIAGATVSASRADDNVAPFLLTDAESGAFAVQPLRPGRYRLTVGVKGFPNFITPYRDLATEETWDLGEIRFQAPGRLVVVPRSAADFPVDGVEPWIERDDNGMFYEVHRDGGRLESGALPAGAYHLFAASPPFAAVALPFVINSGADTVLELPLSAGIERTIRVSSDARQIRLRITASGQSIFDRTLHRPAASEHVEKRLAFAPGEYVVTVTDPSGGTAAESFVVGRDAAAELIELHLR